MTNGLAAWLSKTISHVLPSGGDLATAAVPTLPEAPARFSMMMVAPSRCCSVGWISRIMASVDPAGGEGTTILIVPDGQLCARATSGAATPATMRDRLGSI